MVESTLGHIDRIDVMKSALGRANHIVIIENTSSRVTNKST